MAEIYVHERGLEFIWFRTGRVFCLRSLFLLCTGRIRQGGFRVQELGFGVEG